MKKTHCDICDVVINDKKTIIIERENKKFRLTAQYLTGNGRWNHMWKNVDICDVCLISLLDSFVEDQESAVPGAVAEQPTTSPLCQPEDRPAQ